MANNITGPVSILCRVARSPGDRMVCNGHAGHGQYPRNLPAGAQHCAVVARCIKCLLCFCAGWQTSSGWLARADRHLPVRRRLLWVRTGMSVCDDRGRSSSWPLRRLVCLYLAKAMTLFPGNERFKKNYEFSNLAQVNPSIDFAVFACVHLMIASYMLLLALAVADVVSSVALRTDRGCVDLQLSGV